MATTLYMFDIITREYLGWREAQVVDGVEMLDNPFVTTLPPPAEKEGFAAVFKDNKWTYVTDHRRKYDSQGKLVGGTGYWLRGDDHLSSPRYMQTLGELPRDALLQCPGPPEKSYGECIKELRYGLKCILNNFVRTEDYSDVEVCVSYKFSDIPAWQVDAAYVVELRDKCWKILYDYEENCMKLGHKPSLEVLKTLLPEMKFPGKQAFVLD